MAINPFNREPADDFDRRARAALARDPSVARANHRAEMSREKRKTRQKANRDKFRAEWKKAGEDYKVKARIDRHVSEGQPPFPHLTHTVAILLTGGLWVPVYLIHWRGSEQRRYRKSRKRALRREGLI